MPGLKIVLALAACSAVLSAPAVDRQRSGPGFSGHSLAAVGIGSSSDDGLGISAGDLVAVPREAQPSAETEGRLGVGKRQRQREASKGARGRAEASWHAAAASMGPEAARKLRDVAALRDRTAPSMAGAVCDAHSCSHGH